MAAANYMGINNTIYMEKWTRYLSIHWRWNLIIPMEKILIASSNEDKIREISILLENIAIELVSLEDFGLEPPEESGKTFMENALLKAKFGFERTNLTTIADDSGFCLEALDGFPGIFSGRFAREHGGFESAAELINEMLGGAKSRKAYFITTMAIVRPDKSGKLEEHAFEGRIDGHFCYPGRGSNGFGYCSCFVPSGFDITYGEMENQMRIKHNHRASALGKLKKFLVESGETTP
jgi:XTP/dITP diphosphohydrolase